MKGVLHERIKMAQLFGMTIDQMINYDSGLPQDVILEDKPQLEQYRMMSQLDEDDKQTILKLVEKMLTNKKFKDFFAKNSEGL